MFNDAIHEMDNYHRKVFSVLVTNTKIVDDGTDKAREQMMARVSRVKDQFKNEANFTTGPGLRIALSLELADKILVMGMEAVSNLDMFYNNPNGPKFGYIVIQNQERGWFSDWKDVGDPILILVPSYYKDVEPYWGRGAMPGDAQKAIEQTYRCLEDYLSEYYN